MNTIPIKLEIPEGVDREQLQREYERIAETVQTHLTEFLTELGMGDVAARLTIEIVDPDETEQG